MVISGDQPFIKTETIKNLLRKHLDSGAKITVTTTLLPILKIGEVPLLNLDESFETMKKS